MTWWQRLVCATVREHWFLRVPVDPTMKQTSKTVIKCLYCDKTVPDTHLLDVDT